MNMSNIYKKKERIKKIIMKNLSFGLEIEGNWNEGFFDDEIEPNLCSYHDSSSYNDFGFRFETDGSLSGSNTAELITEPYTYQEINKFICNFKDFLGAINYIGNIVYFNDSTGAHIHVSINNNKYINNITKNNTELKRKISENVLKEIKRYPYIFEKVISSFYRNYAKKNFVTSNRYVSLNTNTNYNTIELRSLNFRGLTTISQIYFIVKLTLDSIIDTLANDFLENNKKTKSIIETETKNRKKIKKIEIIIKENEEEEK